MKQTLPNPMHLWFFYLFESRMDKEGYVKCFECKKKLHEDSYKHLLTCYSHILEKAKYTKYAGEQENVQICCPDCHHLYTMNPKKAVNQYNLRMKLLKQYYEDNSSE